MRMKVFATSRWLLLAAAMLASAVEISCYERSRPEPDHSTSHYEVDRRQAILENMPMNADGRCTGIGLVAEALLHTTPTGDKGCDTADEIANVIFDRIVNG